MKKLIFWGLFLFLPSVLFAQTNQTVLKDFEKKVQKLTNTFQFSDHVNIAQIATDEGFELLAIDDKMQVLWRVNLSGGEAMSGVFKGNVLATAVIAKSKKGPVDYTAYFIDAQTGKLLSQKLIYESTSETWEVPETLFAKDGSWARLVVRQTTVKGHGWVKESDLMATRQLTVFELSDKLEPTTTQCNLQDGIYVGTVSASAESFTVLTCESGKGFKALRFSDGKPEPTAMLGQSLDLPANLTSKKFTTECISSAIDPNVAYLAALYKGADNYKLAVCKFDFKNNSAKTSGETIDNDHIKNIKKSVDEAYKKTGDLALGEVFQFEVQHMAEYNGTVVVSFGDRGGQDPPYQLIQSTVINGYDGDLNQKFQQVMPTSTVYGPTSNIATGYYYRDNKLCVTANTGNMRFATIYGQLDLSTGKWIILKKLEKEKIDGSDFLTGFNLWYKDNFSLIYVPFKNGLNSRIDLSLQQNTY